MKIAIVGYGKMGRMVEAAALERKHEIAATIDVIDNGAGIKVSSAEDLLNAVKKSGADGVIEFSSPDAVESNLRALLQTKIPVVSGTTGKEEINENLARFASECGGVALRSSNFSIGVNTFYKIVEAAAALMSECDGYDVAIWEAHHNQKADSPSGTALELARRIERQIKAKTEIQTDAFHQRPKPNQIHVSSTRIGSTPGTHTVFFDSKADTIEITHRARSREGFAIGAVVTLERLIEQLKSGKIKPGRLCKMDDLFH